MALEQIRDILARLRDCQPTVAMSQDEDAGSDEAGPSSAGANSTRT
jgi:hypothetical protein